MTSGRLDSVLNDQFFKRESDVRRGGVLPTVCDLSGRDRPPPKEVKPTKPLL
jgi:hypothetical protein